MDCVLLGHVQSGLRRCRCSKRFKLFNDVFSDCLTRVRIRTLSTLSSPPPPLYQNCIQLIRADSGVCYCFSGVAGFKGGNYRGLSLSLSQFKIKYTFHGGAVELCWVRRGFPGRSVYILVLIVRLLSPLELAFFSLTITVWWNKRDGLVRIYFLSSSN